MRKILQLQRQYYCVFVNIALKNSLMAVSQVVRLMYKTKQLMMRDIFNAPEWK
jgi:hypothetical protein